MPSTSKGLIGYMEELVREFPDRVRSLMKFRGLNNAELARRMDRTAAEVSRELSGDRQVTSIVKWARYADALHVDLAMLMGERFVTQGLDESFAERWALMTPQQRKVMEDLLDTLVPEPAA